MLQSNFNTINNDVNTLVKDAQALFQSASALTGEKAEEMRHRAMRQLDTALVKGREMQESALASGREMAASADGYVKENPWRAIAATAALALLAGVILARK